VLADRDVPALSGAPPDDSGAGRLMADPVPDCTGSASPPVNV
jgi:hypothetical protein